MEVHGLTKVHAQEQVEDEGNTWSNLNLNTKFMKDNLCTLVGVKQAIGYDHTNSTSPVMGIDVILDLYATIKAHIQAVWTELVAVGSEVIV